MGARGILRGLADALAMRRAGPFDGPSGRAKSLIGSASVIALLLACRAPGGAPEVRDGRVDAEGALRAASAAWDEAHNSADVGALLELYDETAVSMPFDRPALEGRDAIAADLAAFFAEFNARHETTIVSLEVAGDWAIERGAYELLMEPKAGGERLAERGKHIVVRYRVGDAWLVHWEIWNRDAPG